MTSLAPSECCVKGVTHEGTPLGKIETIKSIETYITYPAIPSKNAIVLFSDIFGIHYPNTQLIADCFASKGWLTVVPDLFNGDPIVEVDFFAGKVTLQDWLPKHGTETIDPIAEIIFDYLKSQNIEKIAGVGYCLGGKYVVRNLASAGRLDVGYIAHPSLVTSEEISAINKPLSIAAAQNDAIFTAENRAESEQILGGLNIPFQINLYSGVEHGFAVKGDLSKEQVQFATEQAFNQAVNWFRYTL